MKLLITYDLNKEHTSKNYAEIIEVIKSTNNWAKLSESSYAVETNLTPHQMYLKLKPYVDNGDNLLIFTLNTPYYGQHSSEVVEWLARKFG